MIEEAALWWLAQSAPPPTLPEWQFWVALSAMGSAVGLLFKMLHAAQVARAERAEARNDEERRLWSEEVLPMLRASSEANRLNAEATTRSIEEQRQMRESIDALAKAVELAMAEWAGERKAAARRG